MGKTKPLSERFWGFATPADGCWPWRGARQQQGYGQLRVGRKGPVISAHRLSWELHNGPIPEGLWVLHHCDNPPCVNPDHLFIGTQADNMAYMIAKGRKAKHYKAHTRVRKLTDDQVRAIREDDRPSHYVAADYGVSEITIYSIRTGRRKAGVK